MKKSKLIETAIEAAIEAGKGIISVYESGDFSIEAKSDDSPLTKADKLAHGIIVRHLADTGLPVLSEEGKEIAYSERSKWKYFWMVDPLDGTKEFIKRNGEFTVNIALIHNGKAIAGVVYAPVLSWLYWSIPSHGAYKKVGNESPTRIHCNTYDASKEGINVVASRSHMSDETQVFIDQFKQPNLVSMGSSLKILLVADGSADVYPRFAPTMEWDTAAAHGVAMEAGAEIFEADGITPLHYNKPNLLNPHFIVRSKA